jgi:hypothetical protein
MSSHDSTENEKVAPEKAAAHLDPIKTRERVPGNDNYYEKDGLRTYGDDEDHDHEPPVRVLLQILKRETNLIALQMTFSRFMSLVAMALLWTGSQIPVYLYGGVPPYIYVNTWHVNTSRTQS